jgi:hypothetical protein
MTISEIQRIMNHLDKQDEKISKIATDVVVIVETIKNYESVVTIARNNENAIEKQKERCDNIQSSKIKINKNIVAGEVIVGIVLLVAGYFIGKF